MLRYSSSGLSVLHPSPAWAARYSVRLACRLANLSLGCGETELLALPRPSLPCQAHSQFCRPREAPLFQQPSNLTVAALDDSSVRVEWGSGTGPGWRPPAHLLTVAEEEAGGAVLLEQQLSAEPGAVTVPGLKVGPRYRLWLGPAGEEVPDGVAGRGGLLALLLASPTLALLAEVDLQVNVLVRKDFQLQSALQAHTVWTGQLRVDWTAAEARGPGGVVQAADRYTVTVVGGAAVLEDREVGGEARRADLPGISLNTAYTVSLACWFGKTQFPCGKLEVQTGQPDR